MLFFGCKRQTNDAGISKTLVQSDFISYAEKYSITEIGEYYQLDVLNPWQKAGGSGFTYILGSNEENLPDSLKELKFIKTPVESVILMSTTFISIIDTLEELHSIKGISGSKYVFNPKLKDDIESGLIKDVGFDHSLNYELIIEMNPDVLFLYGVEAGITQTINKLEDLGITVVICADYLENNPLGRAEWLKFFSLFYEKFEIASNIFNGISHRYDSIRKIASTIIESPLVFVGLPWKDTWYIAGGNSFASQFIEDAGGEYVWKNIETTEAEPFDLESVYAGIMDADIWINAGIADDLNSILQHDERFENIKAFERTQVFNNNRRLNEYGGNDYWESGAIKPDVILSDLLRIFMGQSDSLFYYKRLQ